jgi:hypothetical protein
MLNIDMWYENPVTDADRVDCFFYPMAGVYRGNFYKNGKYIGDYVATDSVELEKRLRALGFDWRWDA